MGTDDDPAKAALREWDKARREAERRYAEIKGKTPDINGLVKDEAARHKAEMDRQLDAFRKETRREFEKVRSLADEAEAKAKRAGLMLAAVRLMPDFTGLSDGLGRFFAATGERLAARDAAHALDVKQAQEAVRQRRAADAETKRRQRIAQQAEYDRFMNLLYADLQRQIDSYEQHMELQQQEFFLRYMNP